MCICSSIDINIWVETGEPSKGPNGKDVPVAGVGDGACLVEHAFDPLLQGCSTLETTMVTWIHQVEVYWLNCTQAVLAYIAVYKWIITVAQRVTTGTCQ